MTCARACGERRCLCVSTLLARTRHRSMCVTGALGHADALAARSARVVFVHRAERGAPKVAATHASAGRVRSAGRAPDVVHMQRPSAPVVLAARAPVRLYSGRCGPFAAAYVAGAGVPCAERRRARDAAALAAGGAPGRSAERAAAGRWLAGDGPCRVHGARQGGEELCFHGRERHPRKDWVDSTDSPVFRGHARVSHFSPTRRHVSKRTWTHGSWCASPRHYATWFSTRRSHGIARFHGLPGSMS